MIQKLKKKLIILASALTLLAPAAIPVSVHAQTVETGIQNSLICGSDAIITSSGTGKDKDGKECKLDAGEDKNLSSKIRKLINIFSAIIAVIAVIMIIYGGLRYVASGGKQESVTAAKNTLLYAIVGLVIVALAQAIVHFVLKGATGA